MMKRTWLTMGLCGALLLTAPPARATYHFMVIDQMFPGFEEAPAAQYVVLRMQQALQTVVHGQEILTEDAAGNPQAPFAAFCTTRGQCDLPRVSPACPTPDDCPSVVDANDKSILIATTWAQGLFCLTADLTATGSVPYPDGRVCFGDTGAFGPSCTADGPVDCVAYGAFTGDNGIFGAPAEVPVLGEALVTAAARQDQCNTATLGAMAVCVGGDLPNMACTMVADCPRGACVQCPAGGCRVLLSSAVGFSAGTPIPRNFHGDFGRIDGVAGDADGSGGVDGADVGEEARILFEAEDRCDLPTVRRGSDANFDTHVNAADIVATVRIAARGT